jgi:hypothetical protein
VDFHCPRSITGLFRAARYVHPCHAEKADPVIERSEETIALGAAILLFLGGCSGPAYSSPSSSPNSAIESSGLPEPSPSPAKDAPQESSRSFYAPASPSGRLLTGTLQLDENRGALKILFPAKGTTVDAWVKKRGWLNRSHLVLWPNPPPAGGSQVMNRSLPSIFPGLEGALGRQGATLDGPAVYTLLIGYQSEAPVSFGVDAVNLTWKEDLHVYDGGKGGYVFRAAWQAADQPGEFYVSSRAAFFQDHAGFISAGGSLATVVSGVRFGASNITFGGPSGKTWRLEATDGANDSETLVMEAILGRADWVFATSAVWSQGEQFVSIVLDPEAEAREGITVLEERRGS